MVELESTYLRLAFICHFSIVQGVLLLRQMSKTRFEKKAMKSLAVAELLMMLSSGRMISLCLKKKQIRDSIFVKETYFSTYSSV